MKRLCSFLKPYVTSLSNFGEQHRWILLVVWCALCLPALIWVCFDFYSSVCSVLTFYPVDSFPPFDFVFGAAFALQVVIDFVFLFLFLKWFIEALLFWIKRPKSRRKSK